MRTRRAEAPPGGPPEGSSSAGGMPPLTPGDPLPGGKARRRGSTLETRGRAKRHEINGGLSGQCGHQNGPWLGDPGAEGLRWDPSPAMRQLVTAQAYSTHGPTMLAEPLVAGLVAPAPSRVAPITAAAPPPPAVATLTGMVEAPADGEEDPQRVPQPFPGTCEPSGTPMSGSRHTGTGEKRPNPEEVAPTGERVGRVPGQATREPPDRRLRGRSVSEPVTGWAKAPLCLTPAEPAATESRGHGALGR